jgi:hypothetical protein
MSLLLVTQSRSAVRLKELLLFELGAEPLAELNFFPNGEANGSGVVPNWFAVPTLGVGGDYEIKAETVFTPPDGPFNGIIGSWLSLAAEVGWSLSLNSPSVGSANSGTLAFSIRKVGETAIMASADITFTVERST